MLRLARGRRWARQEVGRVVLAQGLPCYCVSASERFRSGNAVGDSLWKTWICLPHTIPQEAVDWPLLGFLFVDQQACCGAVGATDQHQTPL